MMWWGKCLGGIRGQKGVGRTVSRSWAPYHGGLQECLWLGPRGACYREVRSEVSSILKHKGGGHPRDVASGDGTGGGNPPHGLSVLPLPLPWSRGALGSSSSLKLLSEGWGSETKVQATRNVSHQLGQKEGASRGGHGQEPTEGWAEEGDPVEGSYLCSSSSSSLASIFLYWLPRSLPGL